MPIPRIAVIGAGIAGVCAAADLSRQGFDVRVLERAAAPGGKIREVQVAGRTMDAGPTVFTLRSIFDALFEDAGTRLDHHVQLRPAHVLARHAWSTHERLDLFADLRESADAIGVFAGHAAATSFLAFAAQARDIYSTLAPSFMLASRPSPVDLVRRVGLRGIGDLWNIQPFATLWQALERRFADPRLRQLFGRYATYCGSSPFASPATLMLIAHVEQAGVWYVEGGMHRLAAAVAALATSQGARIHYGNAVANINLRNGRVCGVTTTSGEHFEVDAVISNADNAALAAGLFGDEVRRAASGTPVAARSLSALTWNLAAATRGFDLARHNVFFSADYRAEFEDLFKHRRLPSAPPCTCARKIVPTSAALP